MSEIDYHERNHLLRFLDTHKSAELEQALSILGYVPEKQLAEAQRKIARQEEELRILAAQRQDKQAALTEARALLERVRNIHIDELSPTTAEDIRAFLRKWSG